LLGASQFILIGEVGFQWNNLPDYKKDPTAVRYGRNFIFGPGPESRLWRAMQRVEHIGRRLPERRLP